VTELDPQSSDEVKDLIIEFKMNADFSLNQIQNMIFHFLRMGSQYSELDNSTMNQKYKNWRRFSVLVGEEVISSFS
jgi:hypothetical protein